MTSSSMLVSTASELRIVLGKLVRRLRSEYSFPVGQASVLSRLDRDGAQTASALATAERIRPQSMAQTLIELESDGLISRNPDRNDRRRILIGLTARGRGRLREDRRRREGWLAEAITTKLNPDEQRTLIEALPVLRRLADF